jgi:hypothetical protein
VEILEQAHHEEIGGDDDGNGQTASPIQVRFVEVVKIIIL